MRTHPSSLFSVPLVVLAACAAGGDPSERAATGGKADDANGATFYVSASSVEALERDLSSVRPRVETPLGADPEWLLKPMSCLGFYGPLGPWGPLGLLGPVGDGVWSPDFYVSGDGAIGWDAWAREWTELDGPLGDEGPLGPGGPLGDAYAEAGAFRAGGVFGVLGPTGPLGPVGPLGPLGPVGAHGYTRSFDGDYRDTEGRVVRRAGGFDLYESYREARARALPDNDTSFMVRGRAWIDETDAYPFVSGETQFVTIAVVPESAVFFYPQAMAVLAASATIAFDTPSVAPAWSALTDDFDLEVVDQDGALVGASDSVAFVDWVQAPVAAGTRLEARVTMRSSWSAWSPLSGDYRLFVVGSGARIQTTEIVGDHQVWR